MNSWREDSLYMWLFDR